MPVPPSWGPSGPGGDSVGGRAPLPHAGPARGSMNRYHQGPKYRRKGAECDLMGREIPELLGALPWTCCSNDPPWNPRGGKWKVVVHTAGFCGLSEEQRRIAKKVPGITGMKWSQGKIVEGGTCPIHMDFDIFINVGKDSPYEHKNPDDVEEWLTTDGVTPNRKHDGSCGFMQAAVTRGAPDCVTGMLEDLAAQLPNAVEAAKQRAECYGEDFGKVLHILVICWKGLSLSMISSEATGVMKGCR